MGENGHSFGLEFMRKSELKKKKITKIKRQLLNMIVSNFLYANIILLFFTITT